MSSNITSSTTYSKKKQFYDQGPIICKKDDYHLICAKENNCCCVDNEVYDQLIKEIKDRTLTLRYGTEEDRIFVFDDEGHLRINENMSGFIRFVDGTVMKILPKQKNYKHSEREINNIYQYLLNNKKVHPFQLHVKQPVMEMFSEMINGIDITDLPKTNKMLDTTAIKPTLPTKKEYGENNIYSESIIKYKKLNDEMCGADEENINTIGLSIVNSNSQIVHNTASIDEMFIHPMSFIFEQFVRCNVKELLHHDFTVDNNAIALFEQGYGAHRQIRPDVSVQLRLDEDKCNYYYILDAKWKTASNLNDTILHDIYQLYSYVTITKSIKGCLVFPKRKASKSCFNSINDGENTKIGAYFVDLYNYKNCHSMDDLIEMLRQ